MLMTCMSWATAQSMALTTTWVGPVQPKTRSVYRSALGATPGPMVKEVLWVVESHGPVYVAPAEVTPNPTAGPDTWLPCLLQSSGLGPG